MEVGCSSETLITTELQCVTGEVQAVRLLICILEVFDLNLGVYTNYPD
jgi:hypothetical protein